MPRSKRSSDWISPLAWKIEITEDAARDLEDLDRTIQRRILKYVHERLAPHPDPRKLGDTLV